MISVIKTVSSSVTLLTPAAKVPSGAALPAGWPALRAASTHCRVTESTT